MIQQAPDIALDSDALANAERDLGRLLERLRTAPWRGIAARRALADAVVVNTGLAGWVTTRARLALASVDGDGRAPAPADSQALHRWLAATPVRRDALMRQPRPADLTAAACAAGADPQRDLWLDALLDRPANLPPDLMAAATRPPVARAAILVTQRPPGTDTLARLALPWALAADRRFAPPPVFLGRDRGDSLALIARALRRAIDDMAILDQQVAALQAACHGLRRDSGVITAGWALLDREVLTPGHLQRILQARYRRLTRRSALRWLAQLAERGAAIAIDTARIEAVYAAAHVTPSDLARPEMPRLGRRKDHHGSDDRAADAVYAARAAPADSDVVTPARRTAALSSQPDPASTPDLDALMAALDSAEAPVRARLRAADCPD